MASILADRLREKYNLLSHQKSAFNTSVRLVSGACFNMQRNIFEDLTIAGMTKQTAHKMIEAMEFPFTDDDIENMWDKVLDNTKRDPQEKNFSSVGIIKKVMSDIPHSKEVLMDIFKQCWKDIYDPVALEQTLAKTSEEPGLKRLTI